MNVGVKYGWTMGLTRNGLSFGLSHWGVHLLFRVKTTKVQLLLSDYEESKGFCELLRILERLEGKEE